MTRGARAWRRIRHQCAGAGIDALRLSHRNDHEVHERFIAHDSLLRLLLVLARLTKIGWPQATLRRAYFGLPYLLARWPGVLGGSSPQKEY